MDYSNYKIIMIFVLFFIDAFIFLFGFLLMRIEIKNKIEEKDRNVNISRHKLY